MGIGIVIPAFDEEASIGRLIDEMPDRIAGHELVVVVVDDGSTDATGRVAAGRGVAVLRHEFNRGKAAALRLGMAALAEREDVDAIVWMDADGQHRTGDLPSLVGPILAGSADLVIGSRHLGRRGRGNTPLNRWIVTRTVRALLRVVYACEVTDPFGGFRAHSPSAVEHMELLGERYECELDGLLSVAGAGLPIVEVPIARLRGAGTSSMGSVAPFGMGRLLVVRGYARALWRHRRAPARKRRGSQVPVG